MNSAPPSAETAARSGGGGAVLKPPKGAQDRLPPASLGAKTPRPRAGSGGDCWDTGPGALPRSPTEPADDDRTGGPGANRSCSAFAAAAAAASARLRPPRPRFDLREGWPSASTTSPFSCLYRKPRVLGCLAAFSAALSAFSLLTVSASAFDKSLGSSASFFFSSFFCMTVPGAGFASAGRANNRTCGASFFGAAESSMTRKPRPRVFGAGGGRDEGSTYEPILGSKSFGFSRFGCRSYPSPTLSWSG